MRPGNRRHGTDDHNAGRTEVAQAFLPVSGFRGALPRGQVRHILLIFLTHEFD
jgi:hypothetical protein